MRTLLSRLAAILVAPDPGYLMAHFIGEGATNQQMYLSHSTDGLHWNDLNGGGMVLRSTVGTKGVRDPAFVRSPDGSKYWIIATDLWAPEAIWDPETNDYVLYWATNVPFNGATKHRIFYARTSDFRTITTPQLYIDRPGTQEIIDTQIIETPSGVGLTGSQVEGPMWMKFNGTDKWALYLDQYATRGGYMPVVTTGPSDPATYQKLPSTS